MFLPYYGEMSWVSANSTANGACSQTRVMVGWEALKGHNDVGES